MFLHCYFSSKYSSSSPGSIALIHEWKFKQIINIKHESINTYDLAVLSRFQVTAHVGSWATGELLAPAGLEGLA